MEGRIIPLVVFALCLILPGCMTYQGLFGIEATDLSSLHPGMDRAEVEGVLGSPEETDQWYQGAKVHYDYDRGYISPAEETPGKKALAPFILTLEVMFPVMELYAVCTQVCQKGRLEVLYSKDSQLVAARVIPRDFGGCANTPRLRAGCTGVANRADPSSFPSGLSAEFYQTTKAVIVPVSEEQYRLGMRALARRDDQAAKHHFCLSANEGHGNAQVQMGHLASNKAAPERAFVWYSLATSNEASGSASNLKQVASRMTPAEITEGERLVAEWEPDPAECDVEAVAMGN